MASKKKTANGKAPFIVGIVLYPGFDLLDVAGMNEVWTFVDSSLLGRPIKVITVTADKELTALAPLKVKPSCTFADDPHIDLLFVPGAGDTLTDAIRTDDAQVPAPQGEERKLCDLGVHRRVRARGRRPVQRLPGDLSLVGAGLSKAVSQGDGGERFPALPARPQPFHRRRHLVLDRRALYMVQQVITDLAGAENGGAACQRVQLWIQYNPKPPFKGGDPASVDYRCRAGRGARDAQVPRGGVPGGAGADRRVAPTHRSSGYRCPSIRAR